MDDEKIPRHPDKVRTAVDRQAISKAELARRAGLHANSLSDVESPDWNPRWRTLEALCVAVDEILAERAA